MDRTTKLILAAIAGGLWLNAGILVFRPSPAAAQDENLSSIAYAISSIASGVCSNHKIC